MFRVAPETHRQAIRSTSKATTRCSRCALIHGLPVGTHRFDFEMLDACPGKPTASPCSAFVQNIVFLHKGVYPEIAIMRWLIEQACGVSSPHAQATSARRAIRRSKPNVPSKGDHATFFAHVSATAMPGAREHELKNASE